MHSCPHCCRSLRGGDSNGGSSERFSGGDFNPRSPQGERQQSINKGKKRVCRPADGRVVVFKHIEDGFPQKRKVIIGETGGLAGQIGGDITLAAVETIGDDVFATHFSALLFGICLGGDGHTGDGDLLGYHRLHAAGKAQLHRPAHLAAVESGFYKGGHHGAECTDIIEVGTHPIPDLSVQIRVGPFFLFHVFLRDVQLCIGFPIAAVQGNAVLDINAVAGGVLLYSFHIVADLPLETHVGHDAKAGLRVHPGPIAGVGVVVGGCRFPRRRG